MRMWKGGEPNGRMPRRCCCYPISRPPPGPGRRPAAGNACGAMPRSRGELGSRRVVLGVFACGISMFLVSAWVLHWRLHRADETRGPAHEPHAAHIDVKWIEEPSLVAAATESRYEYPQMEPLGDLLQRWNPDDPVAPPGGVRETLLTLSFASEKDRAKAQMLMEKELPFKLRDVPDILRARDLWDDAYLASKLGGGGKIRVQASESNHFMFYHGGGRKPRGWKPPTANRQMSIGDFFREVKRADDEAIGPDDAHLYYQLGTNRAITQYQVERILEGGAAKGIEAHLDGSAEDFLAVDLPSFDARRAAMALRAEFKGLEELHGVRADDASAFFIREPAKNKGIQCRLGMRGVIAEAHYDAGRNMIAMIRGRKRYVLAPPESCGALDMITSREHPSYRHSDVDWSLYDAERIRSGKNLRAARGSGSTADAEVLRVLGKAMALETILADGEVLYVPSYWFHYIVSLAGDMSVQCNTRHGTPDSGIGAAAIKKCMRAG